MPHKSFTDMRTTVQQDTSDRTDHEPVHRYFRWLIASTVLFITFTFAWLVALLGDSPSPIARGLSRYGHWTIGLFCIASLILGIAALKADNHKRDDHWKDLQEQLEESDRSNARQTDANATDDQTSEQNTPSE